MREIQQRVLNSYENDFSKHPHDWLLDVLQKLPARKANNIDDLLPQNWKPDLQGVV